VIQEFLKTVPLFRELDDDDLAQVLMVGLLRRHPEGAVLTTEGAPGGQLHVIHQGRVRISKVVPGVGEEALAILGPGDFFGEIEFFDGAPASAMPSPTRTARSCRSRTARCGRSWTAGPG
jgi:CRP/FNR family cyclic AMP-dependent transcriptional regulator